MEQFLINALLVGTIIALVTGPLGCFVVWKKMAYFGDSLAHSGLLGITIGILLSLPQDIGIIIISLTFIIILFFLERQRMLPSDTILGILAHASLSLSIIGVNLFGLKISLHSLLFGDILTVSTNDLYFIGGVGVLILATIIYLWPKLVLITILPDLAQAEGVSSTRYHLLFMIMMGLVVTISIKVVGVLLIASLLIIPAAGARFLTHSPHTMAVGAAVIGIISVLIGINSSAYYDISCGPAIVVTASVIFVVLLGYRMVRQY